VDGRPNFLYGFQYLQPVQYLALQFFLSLGSNTVRTRDMYRLSSAKKRITWNLVLYNEINERHESELFSTTITKNKNDCGESVEMKVERAKTCTIEIEIERNRTKDRRKEKTEHKVKQRRKEKHILNLIKGHTKAIDGTYSLGKRPSGPMHHRKE